MSLLEIKNISVSFDGKEILKDISFDVKEGEMISILGPSGCGKSTILKTIAGIIKPNKGDILIGGISALDIPMEERGAVLVFQDYLLFPHMNIEKNIGFGLKMSGQKKEIIKKRVDQLMKLFEIEDLKNKYPNEISGGQKQRVAIARALAIRPKILLLDEPFSNLDIRLKDYMREFIFNIQKKLNITTILVTHDKEEAFIMADRIGVIIDNEISQFAEPKEIYEKPKSKKIADFFGEKNYVDGKIADGEFECVFGRFKIGEKILNKAQLMIKPEDINISKTEKTNIKGLIVKKIYIGSKIDYIVNFNEKLIRLEALSENDYALGEEVFLSLKPRHYNIYEI